jgi:pyruvate formate lyase activating enzyme
MKFSAIQRFTLLDYPGKVACIAFTPGCNMRCGFCHNPEFVLPENIRAIADSFVSEEAFFHFLRERRGLLDGVVVSGGEPTVWPDLPILIQKIKEQSFLVKLDTNGNNPVMLEKLLREGLLDYVAMDVKTSLESYGSLVGVGIDGKNIAKSIELLKAADISYELRTTLIKEIHTEPILTALEKLVAGAREYYLQIFRPGHTLSPVFAGYHPFSPEEMEMLAKRFGKLVGKIGVRSES